jgi:hypothetical protein
MAFVEKLFHGDTVQAGAICLDEREHFSHSFTLIPVGPADGGGSHFGTERLQGFGNDFFSRAKLTAPHLVVDDLYLLGSKFDVHGLDARLCLSVNFIKTI